jgi:hypothetical protein
MRRKILLALLLVAAPAFPAFAAEGPEKAAEKAALAWLAIVDAGKYGASWDAAAEFFRQSLTKAQWEDALAKVRAPLAAVMSRKLKSATFTKSVPGAPAGEYVIIQFETSFSGRPGGSIETVTPMKEADGAWRVSGYYIK